MLLPDPTWVPLLAVLSLALPVALLTLTVLAVSTARPGPVAWRGTEAIAGSALILGLLTVATRLGHNAQVVSLAWPLPAVSIGALGATLLAMTALLLWVLTRYARRYLEGSAQQGRYLRWQNVTLAAVWGVVLFDNLILVTLAWLAVSLSVQPLIRLNPTRTAANLAANQKFLWDRLADLLALAGAAALCYAYATTSLQLMLASGWAGSPSPGWVAAGLAGYALAATIRAAQLPAHRWLLKVMEAPTPVSALLHAGVINLGGMVLLRLSGLLEAASLANLLLVLAGGVGVAFGASTMLRQYPVKTRLAWSSVAQLGLMLLALGLGAYPLVLLHLVAHSLYKAHAFLSAGSLPLPAVEAGPGTRQRAESWLITGTALAAAAVTALAIGLNPATQPTLWVFGALLLASAADLVQRWPGATRQACLQASLATAGLTVIYGVWQHGLSHVVPGSSTPPEALLLWLAGGALLWLLTQQRRLNQRSPLPAFLTRPAS